MFGATIDPRVTAQLGRDFGGDAFGQMGRDFRAGFDNAAISARQALPRRTINALSNLGIPGWQGMAQQRSMTDATQAGLQATGQISPMAGVRLPQERPPVDAPLWQGPNRQLGATWTPPAPYEPTERVDSEPWRQVLDPERPVGVRPRLQVNAITGEAMPPGRRGAAPPSASAPSPEQLALMEDSAWHAALQRAREQVGPDPTGLREGARRELDHYRGAADWDRQRFEYRRATPAPVSRRR